MMKKVLLASLALTLTTSVFAESLKVSIEAKQITTYKKQDKNTFVKINTQGQTKSIVDYTKDDDSVVNLLTNIQNIPNSLSEESLTIESKNIIKFVDVDAGINTQVEADINKSLFGNVKSIIISSENMESIYSESMKKAGLDILKRMNIAKGSITSEIKTSELSCIAEAELLKCSQEQLLILEIRK